MKKCNLQRIRDLVFALSALLLMSPILILASLILKFTGEGEIFFSQVRVGIQEKPIRILKFATMLKNSPNKGAGTITLKDDPRVLPVGKFLRKAKINELPQLINIIKGDLSLIGPRPQTIRCFSSFQLNAQKEISKVKPGLSGIGSIFFRNEEEMMDSVGDPDLFYNDVIMHYKGDLEIWYVSHRSLIVDTILIFLTAWVVLGGDAKLSFRLLNNLPPIPDKLIRYYL